MKTLVSLVLKDLRRDARQPWSILLFAALPMVLTALMGAVFGGQGADQSMPTIRVAVLDQDQDMFSKLLRSLPTQGEAAQKLRLTFVDTLAEGLSALENRKASALVVLPPHLTENLLAGKTNVLELYENPAEQVLPKVVRQGVTLLASVLSGAVELLREPLTNLRALFQTNDLPSEAAAAAVAATSVGKLRHVKDYLFPPLIQFKTVKAEDYRPANPALAAP